MLQARGICYSHARVRESLQPVSVVINKNNSNNNNKKTTTTTKTKQKIYPKNVKRNTGDTQIPAC